MTAVTRYAASSWPGVLDWLVERLCVCSDVQRVLLFGSRARGDYKTVSDIDLAVEGVTDWRTWTRLFQLVDEAPTLLEIDLVQLEQVDPAVRDSIAIPRINRSLQLQGRKYRRSVSALKGACASEKRSNAVNEDDRLFIGTAISCGKERFCMTDERHQQALRESV